MGGQFHPTSLGVDSMSVESLNDIALNRAGIVGGIGYGYATRGSVEPRDGYEFRWIGTGGMGNCGTLVMRGTTPQTRELLRQGRIKRLMGFGASYTQAQRMDGVHTSYVREERVIRAALATYQVPAWNTYPGVGGGVGNWCARNTHQFGEGALDGLSCPRLDAVYALVTELKKLHH